MRRGLEAAFIGIAALLALASSGARAAESGICNGVGESSTDLRIGRVREKVNFRAGAPLNGRSGDCPSESAACRRNAFVMPGDVVLVDYSEGPYGCATFVSRRQVSTEGWLPVKALEMQAASAPVLADWGGDWRRTEASIRLKIKGDQVEVDGDATWGGRDPQRVRNGGVHTGEVSGVGRVSGNALAFGKGADPATSPQPDSQNYECRVRLRLFAPYLVAEDNGNCGGVNVSFSGVYVRAAK